MSRAHWYWIENEAQHGPLGTSEIRERLHSGSLAETTLVWRSGLAEWQAAAEVEDLRPRPSPTSADGDLLEPKELEQKFVTDRANQAGIAIRLAAKALDIFLLVLPAELLRSLLQPYVGAEDEDAPSRLLTLLLTLVYWLYFTLMEGPRRRASFGKRLFGLEVLGHDGHPLSLGRASLRAAVQVLWIGWFFAFLKPQGQCLHDRLSRSIVVRRRPGPTGR